MTPGLLDDGSISRTNAQQGGGGLTESLFRTCSPVNGIENFFIKEVCLAVR
jgi:hypothetical protein